MKNKKTIIISVIIIIILLIYVIYNIAIRKIKKQDNIELAIKEKIISYDLRVGIINFDTVNPIISENTNIQNVSRLIFEPLIDLTEDYKLKPCLAKEWTQLDKNNYILKLQNDVKWQDGKEFDAEDVIFTVNTIKKLKNKSVYYANVQNIKNIKKIDENTIKITVSSESSDFEYNLIFPIMSSKYYNEDNFNSDNKNINPVGTGKYYISNEENKEIILKKNTNWWRDEQLKLDTIKIKKYDNVKKEIDAIKIDDIDIMISSLNNIDEYLNDSKCNQIKYIGRNYDYIAINCNNKILKDNKIRQALSYIINKDEIIKEVYDDKYVKAEFPLDFGSYIYSKNSFKTEVDTEKAKKILEEAGWKYSNNKWIKGKEILRVKILVNKENENRIKVCKKIKEELEKEGIMVDILKEENKKYKEKLNNGNYEIALTGSTYSFSTALENYFDDGNINNYKNKEITKILKNINSNESEEENKIELSKMLKIYGEEVPFISLYYDTVTLITSNKLKGNIKPNSYNIFNNIETWYREYDK